MITLRASSGRPLMMHDHFRSHRSCTLWSYVVCSSRGQAGGGHLQGAASPAEHRTLQPVETSACIPSCCRRSDRSDQLSQRTCRLHTTILRAALGVGASCTFDAKLPAYDKQLVNVVRIQAPVRGLLRLIAARTQQIITSTALHAKMEDVCDLCNLPAEPWAEVGTERTRPEACSSRKQYPHHVCCL
jgi:hypothetical protein